MRDSTLCVQETARAAAGAAGRETFVRAVDERLFGRLARSLRSFEWFVLFFSMVAAPLSRYFPVDPLKLAPDRIFQGLFTAFVIVLTLRLVLPLSAWWRSRHELPPGSLLPTVRRYYRRSYVLYVVRAAVCVQVMLLWFCCIKYVIPYVRPGVVDAALWDWERLVHLGVLPNELALQVTAGRPWLLGMADTYYVSYFPILVLFFTYVVVQERRPEIRDRFILAYCLFWVVGGLSYYVLPSLGPCYDRPALFADALRHMPAAAALQQELITDYRAFVASPWTHVPQLYYGVAAMPSLHVGACTMFACFARRIDRRACWLMIVATLLMFLCSIVTGWHYAIDGYAGAVLGWLCYAVVRPGRAAVETPVDAADGRHAVKPPVDLRPS